jgi:hypothetical protein
MTSRFTSFPDKTLFLIPAGLALAVGIAVTLGAQGAGAAQTPIDLGTATSFSVLASSTVTNTGPSIVHGDLGVSTGTAVTGFPPGLVLGTTHTGTDGVGAQAKSDMIAAYNTAAGSGPVNNVATELAGTSLPGGVYRSDTLGLTGTLTLNGDSSTVWIFQAGSTLITASNSSVKFTGGANACNVFWQIGSSATLGAGTAFAGTVLAHDSISANTGANVEGRLFAQTGAVTLDTNDISAPDCDTSGPTDTSSSSGGTSTSPTGGTGSTSPGSGTATGPGRGTGTGTAGGVPGSAGSSSNAGGGNGHGSGHGNNGAKGSGAKRSGGGIGALGQHLANAGTQNQLSTGTGTGTGLAGTGSNLALPLLGGLLATGLGALLLLAARRAPAVGRHRH